MVDDRVDAAPTVSSLLGQVEGVDVEVGLYGWAYDVDDKTARIEVELWAGDLLIAVAEANRYRADRGSETDPDLNPGFVFTSATLKAAALNLAIKPEATLEVRFKGGQVLPGMPLLNSAALNEMFEEHGAPPADTSYLDLQGALAALLFDARLLRRRPLRPVADANRGFIEQIMLLDRDTVVITGWMHRGTPLEQAAAVLDGEKYDAAFSLAAYERADLPEHAHAFVGVMRTAWRPRPRGSEPFIFFGQQGEYHLRSAPGLKFRPTEEIEGWLSRIPTIGGHPRLMELRQLLLTNEGWTPKSDGGSAMGVALSIDRAVLLPGFGAIIEGWALTGPRRLAGMAVRLGSAVLDLDPGSLRRRSRSDLIKAYPLLKEGAPTAGFVGQFVGQLHRADLLDPMFRLQFTDGTTLTVALNVGAFQQLDPNFDIDQLKQMNPALGMEPRFQAFAAARSELLKRAIADSVHTVMRATADRILILALPAADHELSLVLQDAARHVGRLHPGTALAVVAQPNQNRERILPWLAELRARAPADVSISFSLIENVGFALYACDALTKAHKAEAFAFVGPNTWPTTDGWDQLATALTGLNTNGPLSGPTYLPVAHDLRSLGPRSVDAELFAWTAAAFRQWLATAPVTFDEDASDKGLPEGFLAPTTSAPAVRLRSPGRTAYRVGLDQVLLRDHRRTNRG